jgi:mannosylglycoprotein endo-beta-mannosidase
MWVIARRGDVSYSGEQLSTPTYAPDFNAPTAPWMPALVPGTVLATLVENCLSLDPNVGFNSVQVPDIGQTGPEAYTYWFCREFDCSIADIAVPVDKLRWLLEFDGINYSFELYVNGNQVPIPNNRGMFLQHRIDLGKFICDGSNIVAVLVYPPDHPGKIEGGGQGGDHALAQDVASQFFEGWDWIIPVADRGTGIWGGVRLRPTGDIQLSDPWARTMLLPENPTAPGAAANIFASVCVTNVSTERQSVVLNLVVEHSDAGVVVVDIVASEIVTVPPLTVLEHSFSPCVLTNALRWWPIDMGDQPLYVMSVEATQAYVSDYCETTFGVRELKSFIDTATGGRAFAVNGRNVFVRGANYICSDFLLRQPAARVWHEVQLHAQARINMLRCWGGAGCQPRALYQACDAYGLLVWVEFWITGIQSVSASHAIVE